MLDKLKQKREALAGTLSEARQQYEQAAFDAVTGSDKSSQKKVTTLSDQIKAIEAEITTLDAAILHAAKLEAEKQRASEEAARRQAEEEHRRTLQRAINSMEQSVVTAGEIDQIVNSLGAAYRRWREQFEACRSAVPLGGIGQRDLIGQIRDRLVVVGIIDDASLTSAQMRITAADTAGDYASPFINEARQQLATREE